MSHLDSLAISTGQVAPLPAISNFSPKTSQRAGSWASSRAPAGDNTEEERASGFATSHFSAHADSTFAKKGAGTEQRDFYLQGLVQCSRGKARGKGLFGFTSPFLLKIRHFWSYESCDWGFKENKLHTGAAFLLPFLLLSPGGIALTILPWSTAFCNHLLYSYQLCTNHPALPVLSTVPSVQNWDSSWHMGAPGLTQINAFCRNAALVSFVRPLLGQTLWCSSSEKFSFFSFLLIEVDIIDILQCDISTFND